MMATERPLKFDLPVGSLFMDSKNRVWRVKESHARSSRRKIRFDKFTATIEPHGIATTWWTKARGKCGDLSITITDQVKIAAHIERIQAAQKAADEAAAAEREREAREQDAHNATTLHKLAERIANCKGVGGWDYACSGWEVLGEKTLRVIERRLIDLGKLQGGAA